jgi:hypothetical protein
MNKNEIYKICCQPNCPKSDHSTCVIKEAILIKENSKFPNHSIMAIISKTPRNSFGDKDSSEFLTTLRDEYDPHQNLLVTDPKMRNQITRTKMNNRNVYYIKPFEIMYVNQKQVIKVDRNLGYDYKNDDDLIRRLAKTNYQFFKKYENEYNFSEAVDFLSTLKSDLNYDFYRENANDNNP